MTVKLTLHNEENLPIFAGNWLPLRVEDSRAYSPKPHTAISLEEIIVMLKACMD
jgi:hypothetical protein